MGLTTSESIGRSVIWCPRCSRKAKGGILLNGRCSRCVRPSEAPLIEGMVAGAKEPEPALPGLVAADPLSNKRGVHPLAAEVIRRIRVRRQQAETQEERQKWSGATPENVAEVMGEGELKADNRVLPASIPPPPGQPDPAMDELVRTGATNGYTIRKRKVA